MVRWDATAFGSLEPIHKIYGFFLLTTLFGAHVQTASIFYYLF